MPTNEYEGVTDELVARTFCTERELGVGDWGALSPALRASITRTCRAVVLLDALHATQRASVRPPMPTDPATVPLPAAPEGR